MLMVDVELMLMLIVMRLVVLGIGCLMASELGDSETGGWITAPPCLMKV